MFLGDIMAKKDYTIDQDMNIATFIKIVVAILVILAIFAGITKLVTKKEKENTEPVIQYTKIIAGSILNRGEEDYYVLVEKSDDENLYTYATYIDKYNKKENHLRFYLVDLSDPFNASYLADEANYTNEIDKIKFNKTTLLHIKNGKISSYREDDAIKTYLEGLSA